MEQNINNSNSSEALQIIESGKNIQKDRTAKIICSDPNFLGRSIRLIFPEYANLSDEEVGDMIYDVQLDAGSMSGTIDDEERTVKFFDIVFSLKQLNRKKRDKSETVLVKLIMEPNFYKLTFNEYIVRSFDYVSGLYQKERAKYKSDYTKGVKVHAIWIALSDELKGKSITISMNANDALGNVYDVDLISDLSFTLCFVDLNYETIDKEREPLASFYSTVFTNKNDKSDKIKLLEKEQKFMFRQDAQNEIEINGLEFGYNEMYLDEIRMLKKENKIKDKALAAKDEELAVKDEALAAKDAKIKANNIATIKGIMHDLNLDFDIAFKVARFDPSLKEEYRKLIVE